MFLNEVNKYIAILPTFLPRDCCLKKRTLSLEFFEFDGGEYEDLHLLIQFEDIQALHLPSTLCHGPFTLKIATLEEAAMLIPSVHFSAGDFDLEERKCFYLEKNGRMLGYYIDAFSFKAKTVPEVWKGAPIPAISGLNESDA